MKVSREPAVWLGLVESVLAVAVVFNIGLTTQLSVILMAVVSAVIGVITAILTRDAMLAVLLGLIKSLIALAAYFGWNWSEVQVQTIMTVVPLALALFNRTQTTPDSSKSLSSG